MNLFSKKQKGEINSNRFLSFFSAQKRWRFVFVPFALILLLFFAAQSIAPVLAAPPQTPLTQQQIEQIPGWDNWSPTTPPPSGTRISDNQIPNDQGILATYHLVPSNQFTVTNAVGTAYSAASTWLTKQIWTIVVGVLDIIAYFLTQLVSLIASALDVVLKAVLYVNLVNNPMIIMGWTAVRDIANMFFLVVLLFIAFCTILQIDKYHIKKTLLTLIIMALLINFSKPIAIFIFDGSQLLMNYFLQLISSNGKSFSSSLANVSGIADLIYGNLPKSLGSLSGAEIATQYLFAILFLFMFAVALIILVVYLFIRIVAVMILIIVSPVAFFANILPDFSGMSTQWWKAMIKYSYVGPAIAFFLLLSTKLSNAIPGIGQATSGQTIANLINNIIHYLVVLIFLYASIIISEKFGIQFAGAITKRADSVLGWGARNLTGYGLARWGTRKGWEGAKYATRAGAKWGERKLLMPHGLSPRALWQAWKERADEIDRRALAVSAGGNRDMFHKYLDGTQTNYQQLAIDRIKSEEMKRYKEHSEDFSVLGSEMGRLVGSNMKDAPEKLAAIFRIAYSNRDQDEIIGYIRKNWNNKVLGNGKTFGQLFGEETLDKMNVDGFNVSRAVEKMFQATQERQFGKINQGYINKELSDLGQIAASNGSVGFGAVKMGPDGKLMRTSGDEQGFIAARKHQTVFEPQDRAKKEHRNWETNEYNPAVLSRAAIEKMRWTAMADIAQASRVHPSRLEQVGSNKELNDTLYKILGEMKKGSLKVWNPKESRLVEIKNTQNNYVQQAEVNAAHRAALQMEAGVQASIIQQQLTENGFKIDEINKLLKQAKHTEIGKEKVEQSEKK